MSLILSIQKERLEEIIHREITRGMRLLGLYTIVEEKSPRYCKFPPKGVRNLDLDYQKMNLDYDYTIGQDVKINLFNLMMAFPIRVIEYGKLGENPYAKPSGGPVMNRPFGPPDSVIIKVPVPITLNLWQTDDGDWDGSIDWQDIVLDQSMVTFVN